MNYIDRYINLDGLQKREIPCTCNHVKFVVKHDNIKVFGKGMVQLYLERIKR